MFKKSSQLRDLFESERSFRLLVEGVADYALYMLDPSGSSRAGTSAASASRAIHPKRSSVSIFPASTPRSIGPRQACAGARHCPGQGPLREEGWRVRKDGTFFWASVVIDPIYEDDRLIGYAKITRDITERPQHPGQLEGDAETARRVPEVRRARPAHRRRCARLQQPLMIISGSLHILKRDAATTPSFSARSRRSRPRPSAAPR